MKIIATTGSSYLIEAGEGEVAHLIGYYWRGSDGCPQIKIGLEIQVSKMYSQLTGLASKKGFLEKTAESLEAVATLLRVHSPVLDEVASEIEASQKR